MPDVYELAAQFRSDLIARDDAARRRLVASYFSAYKRLAAELAVLTSQIEEARAAGTIFSPSWLYRQDRYQQLIAQLIREITVLSRDAADLIEARQAEEVARGLRDAAGLATAQIAASSISASFTQLPTTALEYLVGTLGDGSPLMERLRHLPESAREDVRRALTEGLAEGAGPGAMARRMRQALGGNLDRALTIARTESLRAYRQAQIASFQANRDLITEWEWSCSFSRRTCLNCLALDGKLFPIERPVPAHVNCRCSTIPRIKALPPLKRQTGAEWFAAQPDAVQKEMMGPKAFAEYKAGRVSIEDFQGEKTSPQWGTMTYQRSLISIQAGTDAPTWTRGTPRTP